ncbi:MAG: tRNA dihydrouridine synthase DusB [Candidatus Sericytochromatia bacterium]
MPYNLPYLKYKNLVTKSRAVLAPMAGVTDIPFRLMVRKWAKESLVFTEMITSVSFVQSRKLEEIAKITEEDHPIIFQFCGNDPYFLAKAAERAQKNGADGIDINMGCPTQKIAKKGEGAGLLRDIKKAQEILKAVVKSTDLPVSVKLRAGWDDNSIIVKEYSQLAENCGLAAIAIHGRTKEQLYSGKANWDHIKLAQEVVNIPVIGSGDLFTPEDAKNMLDYTKCAGVWVARGCLGAPWIVAQIDNYINYGKKEPDFTPEEKINFMIEHLLLMVKYLGEKRAVLESRKHIGWIIKNFPESEKVRQKINTLLEHNEVIKELELYQKSLK